MCVCVYHSQSSCPGTRRQCTTTGEHSPHALPAVSIPAFAGPGVCVSVKRDLFICQKRPIHSNGKRDLFIWPNRGLITFAYLSGALAAARAHACNACQLVPRCASVLQETYSCAKRDLFMCQKRPVHVPKETYSYGKKRPIHMAKRGLFTLASDYVLHQVTIHMAKETYLNGKKDLFIWQKEAYSH